VHKNQYLLLNGILESTDSAVFSLDREYRYTSFNSHHARVMKQLYDADIEPGSSIFDYQSVKEDQERAKHNIDRALAGEHVTEEAFSGEEGRSRRYFEVTHSPVKDADNNVIGVAIFAQDITERKRAEDALKESEERYLSLFDRSLDCIYIHDLEGNFIDANPAALKLLGYTRDDIPHLSFTSLISGEQLNKARDTIRAVVESGSHTDVVEYRLQAKNGKFVDIETKGSLILHNKKPYAIFGIARDSTDKKRVEDALRESEERYRRITEGLTDYLYTVRVQDGRAVSTTHGAACVAVTGYTAEEFGADPYLWIRMVFEEDRNRVISHVNAVLKGTSVPPVEHRIVRKDGQIRWVRDTPILQRDADGMLVSYDGVIKDITEPKLAEEALQKNTDELLTSFNKLTSSEEELRQSIDDLGWSEQALRRSEGRVRLKLESLLAPEGDIGSLELGDIIDVQEIQSMMDDFYTLTHIGIAILDIHGKILVATGWQDICTQFHRINPQTCANCEESDAHLSKGVEPGTFRLYRCKNNMWDMVTPITLGGTHIGNIFLGQFLFDDESVDYDLFRAQAGRYGFEESSYIAALERVPRWNRATVDTVMKFYTKFAQLISTLSYRNLTLARTVNERDSLLTSLQKSEDKFRTLVEFAPIGFYLTDPDGKCLLVNKEWSRISGLTPQEAKGSGWVTGLHPDDRDTVMASWDRMVKSRGAWGLEYRFLPKGREPVFVYGIATALLDKNGIITGYIGANIDISDRKRKDAELLKKHEELMASYEQLTAVEEELKGQFDELSVSQEALIKSEERFRLTLDATNDGIWDWNILKGTTFFSPHWYTMLGYEPDEMPASHATWRSLIHPDDMSLIEQKMKDHIRTHVGYAVEVRMRTKQGNWCWILSRGRVIEQDKDGFPVRVIGTHTDITERKGAEEQLHKTVDELKRFNNVTVDRELRMITLKQEINTLLKNAGEEEKYRMGP